jgi:hypothetical protein
MPYIKVTMQKVELVQSFFEEKLNSMFYVDMHCYGKEKLRFRAKKVKSGPNLIWNSSVVFKQNNKIRNKDILLDAKFILKETRTMLGIIDYKKKVGIGTITIKKGELTAGTIIVDIEQFSHRLEDRIRNQHYKNNSFRKPYTPVSEVKPLIIVAKLHIKVEEMIICMETKKNDNLSLSSHGSSAVEPAVGLLIQLDDIKE